jgi:hypothetical protein
MSDLCRLIWYALIGLFRSRTAFRKGQPKCPNSQNGRGGLFYVINDAVLIHGA